jgi:hypothetical protein
MFCLTAAVCFFYRGQQCHYIRKRDDSVIAQSLTVIGSLTLIEPLPLDQHPAAVYVAGFAKGSRHTILGVNNPQRLILLKDQALWMKQCYLTFRAARKLSIILLILNKVSVKTRDATKVLPKYYFSVWCARERGLIV